MRHTGYSTSTAHPANHSVAVSPRRTDDPYRSRAGRRGRNGAARRGATVMGTLTTVVAIVVVGLVLLGVAALLLGILDSAQSSAWRRIAAERRATWERRRYALRRPNHVESWSDQDDS